MLKVAVLVSGGGTNLQAILDAADSGKITNTEIRVVISNNEGAYALERAKNYGTEALLLSPKSFETREEFNQKLLEALKERDIDLVVLAGYLVVVPPCVIKEYENRIINIHPSLIPSFCGKGCYGLHVHEKALARGVKVSGAQGDTPEVLQRRIMEQAEWNILPETINLIANGKVHVDGRVVTIDK